VNSNLTEKPLINLQDGKTMSMFCFQCEQRSQGVGCTAFGVCGKDPETASMQDLLIHACKSISRYAHQARPLGGVDHEIDQFVTEALFTTVTNVNFDPDNLAVWLDRAGEIEAKAKAMRDDVFAKAGQTPPALPAMREWSPSAGRAEYVREGEQVGIETRQQKFGEDISGLQELLLYGVKGTAAYAEHAMILGVEDDEVYGFFHEALSALTDNAPTVDGLLGLVLKCGEVNLKVMGMLDQGHTETYGHPEPTAVRVTPVKGKAILVSGHDLKDLHELLKQTEGTGVNIYTHGEMLPAHGYPELKKYPHLVGNYGGAWQDQQREFDEFPGAILMTTNCIQRPRVSYESRIFTCGLVEWPGVTHISDRNFAPVIQAAQQADGFTEDAPEKKILTGFGHNAVMSVAPQVIDAVKQGQIRHFFLVGGCDGAKPGRNYYTEFAQSVPDDCVILTLACGKYRFNKLEFGDIGGIPRLLDIGQCNDAYSAIQIAGALAEAFDCSVNDLPLSMILSWYEQKAVCILLTLLFLGIKNIKLGPTLPAFVSPAVLQVLVDNFQLAPITTPDQDLAECLA
jgi:hydroxylamine reductase